MSSHSWAEMSAFDKLMDILKTGVLLCMLSLFGVVIWVLFMAKPESPEIEHRALQVAQEEFQPSDALSALKPSHSAWTYSGLCTADIHNNNKHGVTFNVDIVDERLSVTRKHFDYCVDVAHRELFAQDAAAEAAMAK